MLRKVNKLKIRDFSSCLLSALLLAAPFLNVKFSLFAWFGFVPFFLTLRDKNKPQAFVLSFFTGAIFWGLTIYWLINVTLFGQILLVLFLSLYFGIFGLFSTPRPKGAPYLIFLPSLWVALEYARSHLLTGFPWALLGYSQYSNLAVIQIADITGVWGLSFLILLVNLAVKEAIARKRKAYLFLIGVLLLFTFIYGFFRLGRMGEERARLKISVIQANIPQELKWDMRARDLIMQKYFELTLEAAKDNPDLIIWPEAALPVVLEEEPAYYLRLCDYIKRLNKPLLFGSVTLRQDSYYNSALLLSADGELLNQYDKLHLVPFGEYIPFRDSLRFLDTIAPIGDITRGKVYTIFGLPVNFGVLICFEDVFPELARNFVNRGAKFLVNITNDAWFGKTPEAYQHLSASVFRAVENRVYMVRCANTGVSAFISPQGLITASVVDQKGNNIFISGYRTKDIAVAHNKPSFYNRYGDIFPVVCILFALYVIIFEVCRKK